MENENFNELVYREHGKLELERDWINKPATIK